MRYLAGGGTVNALYVGSNPTPRAKASPVPGSSPGGTAKICDVSTENLSRSEPFTDSFGLLAQFW